MFSGVCNMPMNSPGCCSHGYSLVFLKISKTSNRLIQMLSNRECLLNNAFLNVQ